MNASGILLDRSQRVSLARALSASELGARLHFGRTHTGHEVDFVLELGGRLVAIEVKMSPTLSGRDFRGLSAFRETFGDRVVACRLLDAGREVRTVDRQTAAVPLQILEGRPCGRKTKAGPGCSLTVSTGFGWGSQFSNLSSNHATSQ